MDCISSENIVLAKICVYKRPIARQTPLDRGAVNQVQDGSPHQKTQPECFPHSGVISAGVVISLNFFKIEKTEFAERRSLTTVLCITSLKIDLIQNFACRKRKLSSTCIFLPTGLQNLNQSTLTLLIILSGDIECHPGPRNVSVFPCGYCECPVNWTDQGVCCDGCGI